MCSLNKSMAATILQIVMSQRKVQLYILFNFIMTLTES